MEELFLNIKTVCEKARKVFKAERIFGCGSKFFNSHTI